nr:probable acyl-activating enzyme 16, chloroplastic [Tanacetum cinerariifolium]
MISVPLVFQTLYSGIQKQISTSSAIRKLGKCLSRIQKQPSYIAVMLDWLYARVIAAILLPLHVLATKIVYSKIHSSIGLSKAGICGGVGSRNRYPAALPSVQNFGDIVPAGPGDRFLSMLPPWHAYERACEYFILSSGTEQVYTSVKHLKVCSDSSRKSLNT